jgi:capsular exopolysaccharide synthesis family protein
MAVKKSKKTDSAARSIQRVSENTFITLSDPKSPISEAYRTIRTNLQFASLDKPVKTILVTSTAPGEGKSTTITNLAVVLAQENKRVLIIDADLRKSMQHKLWHIPNMNGLTNVLAESMDYRMAVRKTLAPGVDVLVAGPKPPNPTELLASRRMADFIKKVAEDYDYVLIDASPVMPVTDAVVLSAAVDGVILVVGYGLTTYEAAANTKEQLGKANANILGVIINNVPIDSHAYYYYYYYDESGNKVERKRHKSDMPSGHAGFEMTPGDDERPSALERNRKWME